MKKKYDVCCLYCDEVLNYKLEISYLAHLFNKHPEVVDSFMATHFYKKEKYKTTFNE
jgi:hypothetical protein